MPNRRTNPDFRPKELDQELFHELFHILHGSMLRGNYSATSRVLGCTRKTAIRYATTAPTQWWWNKLLVEVIKDVYADLVQSGSKLSRGYAKRAMTDLMRVIPRDAEYMEFNAANNDGARKHLLSLFRELDQVSTRQLKLPRFSGGHSPRILRRAAEELELDKVTEGYGDEKVTYYRLPESDD